MISPTYSAFTNAAATGGSFQFSGPGTILVASPISIETSTTFDANGHSVVVSGNAQSSILHLRTNTALTLKGLSFIDGLALGSETTYTDSFGNVSGTNQAGFGGAIQNIGGYLAIQNCVFSNNFASGVEQKHGSHTRPSSDAYGGAIWQIGGTLTIGNSLFITNRSVSTQGADGDAAGGAIFITGANRMYVSNSIFSSNQTLLASKTLQNFTIISVPARGGAIAAEGTPAELVHSKFLGNTVSAKTGSALGGALFQTNSTLTVSNLFASHNTALGGTSGDRRSRFPLPALGGAIFSAGTARITHSAFLTNSARAYGSQQFGPLNPPPTTFGGAIFGRGASAALNSTHVGNISETTILTTFGPFTFDHEAGAFYIEGQAGITNCTFVGHSTSLSTIASTNTGSVILKNSILAKNRFAGETNLITDAGHNLNSEAFPQFTASTSTNNVDPRLGPLGYYGGSTLVYPLLAGSPAIDRADDSAASPTDQRGRARPFGLHADIGAFESSPPFYIWGSIQGHIDPSTRITVDGKTFTTEPNGDYLLALPQGAHSATLSATNARFRPNPWLLSVTADGHGSPVTSFELHAISPDRTAEPPSFTLAGDPGEVWNLQASLDLNLWSHFGDVTLPDTGLHTLHATNNPPHLFLRATYTPAPR